VQVRERQTSVPTHRLLDLDGTDDPTHGDQEGSASHGDYQQHLDHPLRICDGETDHLLTAVWRPGTVHASRGVVAVRTRLVGRLRARWPGLHVARRAASGFAVPARYEWCAAEGIAYTRGLPTNSRLADLAAPVREQAEQQREQTGEQVCLADEIAYAAGTWTHPRRVVFKAEALEPGPNVRFVVTTRSDAPLALDHWYVPRGTPEQWIDDLKGACCADRLSCHRCWAHQFRLLLHAAAYWLLDTLRRWWQQQGVAPLRLATRRLRLLKIGGWVPHHAAGFRLHLASSHPAEPLWQLLLARSPSP
jgi:hypothetical protein